MDTAPPPEILAAEDAEHFRAYLARILTREGYRVRLAEDGRACLEAVRERRPSVLLLDLGMPALSGFQVLEKLRASPATRDLPVIVLTGEKDLDALVRGFELGADDYLTKPFQIPELRARIEALLRVQRLQATVREQAEQLEQELDMAREVQQSLIPMPLPACSGLRLAAAYRPCHALAGDFFDVFSPAPDASALFLADVVGHGASAALLTSFLKAHLSPESLAADDLDPTGTLTRIDRALLRAFGERGLFVTGVLLVHRAGSSEVLYGNAGHPAPLLVPADGPARFVEGSDLPLGVTGQAHYEARRFDLEPGGRVYLYTDGIHEQRGGPAGELFGKERLRGVLEACRELPLQESVDALVAAVVEWAGVAHLSDDVNVLVLERAEP